MFAVLASVMMQIAVVPGHAALIPTCRPDSVAFELVYAATGQPERVTATLRRSTWTETRGGEPVCVVVQRYDRGAGGADADTSVLHARTLAPLTYSAGVGAERHEFAFEGIAVRGSVRAADSVRVVNAAGDGAFFLAAADHLVMAALSGAVGRDAISSFTYLVYNPPRGFSTVKLRVLGGDTVSVGGRVVDAWRLSYDAGAAPTTMWISRSDGSLLRSRSDLANGVFWRRRI